MVANCIDKKLSTEDIITNHKDNRINHRGHREHREKATKKMVKQLVTYERDWLTHNIIGAAIEVHKEMGPGLLKRIYENALCVELAMRNLRFDAHRATQK